MNSLFDKMNIKVNEKCQFETGELHVGEYRFMMDFFEMFNRLDFNDQFIVNNNIRSETDIKCRVFITGYDALLTGVRYSPFIQFVCKSSLINTFKQTRSQCGMNFLTDVNGYSS